MMPNATLRTWTEHDIAKLRSLAGMAPTAQIADQLGRTQAAVVMQAFKMRLSLRLQGPSQYDVATANGAS
jgi:hypothetical protein